ncbi:hypothetical protein GCM10009815_30850 [Nocardioides marmoribigeumensis]
MAARRRRVRRIGDQFGGSRHEYAAQRCPHPPYSNRIRRTRTRAGLPRRGSGERYKRQSLLLDDEGVVRHVQMPITDPSGSVAEMLEAVRSLRGRGA